MESRLSKERGEKEKLEKLLDETREQNRQFALAIGTRTHEKKQHKQIIELQNELEQVSKCGFVAGYPVRQWNKGFVSLKKG